MPLPTESKRVSVEFLQRCHPFGVWFWLNGRVCQRDGLASAVDYRYQGPARAQCTMFRTGSFLKSRTARWTLFVALIGLNVMLGIAPFFSNSISRHTASQAWHEWNAERSPEAMAKWTTESNRLRRDNNIVIALLLLLFASNTVVIVRTWKKISEAH